ncbi:TIR domain-containing protein [Actinoplanes sp. NPDC051470]|uniref:TIR domain-containing protein n=1 Tax=Actinoplanes sp. NPDC051470 TaxID=3157224 RepID=UPI0034449B48
MDGDVHNRPPPILFSVAGAGVSFNGFISYSHAADGRLAPAVQRGLHRLAKPWHRRRALWIFRDQTGLSVTPALWTSIQTALDKSEYFVLMASPEAAQSPWVNREIEHWVANKPLDHILPVVTDGDWRWDPAAKDFDADSTSVPPALRGVFAEEPLYLDLRWARDDQHLSLRHSRFRDAIAQLAAPMHGVSKDDLEGEDVRQHRRAGRLRLSAVAMLLLLTVLASVTGMSAVQNAAQANASAVEARRQEKEATAQRGNAARFADEATRQEDLARDGEARARGAAAEAQKQEEAAKAQKALADKASGDVKVQLAKADAAAARAKRQQQLAARQSALARESAKEMRRQQDRAKEQEQLAKEQQKLAGEAGDEAARQKQIAADQEKLALEAGAQARAQEKIARQQEQKAKEAGDEAARQQKIAISRRLVNEAKATVNDDSRLAFKLGVAAQKINPADDIKRDLAGLVTSTRHLGSIEDVFSAVPGPNGLLATSQPETGVVTLWNAAEPARRVKLSTIDAGRDQFAELAFSPNGKTLAVIFSGGAELWNIGDPAHPRRISVFAGGFRNNAAVAFSPDGLTLAIGDRSQPSQPGEEWGYATLYDLADLSQPAVLSVLRQGIGSEPTSDISFNRDGQTLAVAMGTANIWDVSDRAHPALRSRIPLNHLSYGMAYSPTQELLAVGDYYGTVNVWDMRDISKPTVFYTFTSSSKGNLTLAFSPDGKRLAAGFADATAIVWDATDGDKREIARIQGRVQIGSVLFSRDLKTLVTVEGAETAVLWGLEDFAGPQRGGSVRGHSGVVALQYARDGKTVVTAGNEGTAVFWKVSGSDEPVHQNTLWLHAARPITRASFSVDLRTVVAGDQEHIMLQDLTDPAKPAPFASMKLPEFMHEVLLSPDGRYMLMAATKKFLLWDISNHNNLRQIASVDVPGQVSPAAAFSADGKKVAISAGKKVNVWDITKPSAPKLLGTTTAGHAGAVTAVSFSPDGQILASGSQDRSVVLTDISNPAEPELLSTMTGHAGAVGKVVFSADAKSLLVADWDRWSTVWDIAQSVRPVRLSRTESVHNYDEGAIAFSPDGQTLAIGTNEPFGVVGMWDLAPMNRLRADPAAFSCAITGAGLSKAEWARLVPELDYRKTC